MNKFSVIIPSRNADNLILCVKAIREAGETCRIIVVDDGLESTWNDYFNSPLSSKEVILVSGKTPFIFARNINLGIRAAGGDDVILLNDDAQLRTKYGFEAMASACYVNSLGMLASTTDMVGNPNQHPRKTEPDTHDRYAFRPEPRMLCFVCVYIPRTTIDIVGFLDERYTGYGLDDDDYSLRVRNAGLNLGVYDGCFVDHGSLRSSFRGPAGRGGDFTGNMKVFIEKWGHDNHGRTYRDSQFKTLFPEHLRV